MVDQSLFILRLFDKGLDNPPMDARLLREGNISFGRDPSADWVLDDRERRLSRQHFDLMATGNEIALRACGANGVFDDRTGIRFSDGAYSPLPVPAVLRFGDFRLTVEHAAQSGWDDDRGGQTLILSPPLGTTSSVPIDYTDGSGAIELVGDGSLLDCFCQGAGIEPSAFALEEPAEVMRRAGAVYRQMVLGVGDLMAERERVRRRYEIARTTIGGEGNNPFKWGPTQRLALDLLLAEGHGFLSGPAALAASFADIKKHLIATFHGLHATLRAAVGTFDPEEIEREASKRPGLLSTRASLNFAEVVRRHADLQHQLDGGVEGALNATFVQAYDAAVACVEGAEG